MNEHDLIIVGAGPAGMSSALNAKNDGLDFKLLESYSAGWFPQVSVDSHYTVDNYLGFSKVSGTALINSFLAHLAANEIFPVKQHTVRVKKTEKGFEIETDQETHRSRTLILATGTKQKKLEASGIEKFLGKEVFYYCVPDGKQFVGKKVIVVGGRNTGAVTALYLQKMGCDVTVIEKAPQLNAKDKYAKKINAASIPFRTGTEIISLNGTTHLESILVRTENKVEELGAEGIFVCVGLEPNNDLAKQIGIKLDPIGYIEVNRHMATNVAGAYAAGDITGNLKQIVVAAAQGSIAAYNASKYLRSK